jgi:hypothetical protein
MSEAQSAISFKVPAELRRRIGEITKKHNTTLTALVLDYFTRRVQAEEEAEARAAEPGRGYVEVDLLLEDGLYAGLCAEATRRRMKLGDYLRHLCEAAVRGEPGQPAGAAPPDYPDFPKLVECVRRAYQEDRSPVDALLSVYPTLAPSAVPMEALFTAALAAVPVGQVISERVELGLRVWREKGRGGRGTEAGPGPHRKRIDS